MAQHSVLVEKFCTELRPGWPAKWRLAALLHDAPEFVIGDLISPFKAALGGDYKAIERRLMRAVHLRFGLPADLPEPVERLIKRADRASAFFEATQLAGFTADEARRFSASPPALRRSDRRSRLGGGAGSLSAAFCGAFGPVRWRRQRSRTRF